MMTKQRKSRLKKKLHDSRSRIMGKYPFFALLLMYLKFVAVSDMKKISTNGRCIYFSPDFIDKLYDHEIDYVLCHQVMHIVCEHIWRPNDLKGDDYHYACDVYINLQLENFGMDEYYFPHLGEVHKKPLGIKESAENLSEDEIFELASYSLYMLEDRSRNKFLPDNDSWWDRREDNGSCGEIIIDLPDISRLNELSEDGDNGALYGSGDGCGNDNGGDNSADNGKNGIKEDWKMRKNMAALATMSISGANDCGYGDMPDFLKRLVGKSGASVIDWKKMLNNFLQANVCDYSFSPPDRRFADTDFFLPDFNEKDFVTQEIWFMVDTSGSITDDFLNVIYSEIRGAIEQYAGKLAGKIGFFDTEVKCLVPFETVEDLMSIVPIGGGGTDFRSIFEFIVLNNINNLPACLVIFTDGEGPYPLKSDTMNIPILWIINGGIKPPFGKVISIYTPPGR